MKRYSYLRTETNGSHRSAFHDLRTRSNNTSLTIRVEMSAGDTLDSFRRKIQSEIEQLEIEGSVTDNPSLREAIGDWISDNRSSFHKDGRAVVLTSNGTEATVGHFIVVDEEEEAREREDKHDQFNARIEARSQAYRDANSNRISETVQLWPLAVELDSKDDFEIIIGHAARHSLPSTLPDYVTLDVPTFIFQVVTTSSSYTASGSSMVTALDKLSFAISAGRTSTLSSIELDPVLYGANLTYDQLSCKEFAIFNSSALVLSAVERAALTTSYVKRREYLYEYLQYRLSIKFSHSDDLVNLSAVSLPQMHRLVEHTIRNESRRQRLASKLSNQSKAADELYRNAMSYFTSGNSVSAIDQLSQSIALNPAYATLVNNDKSWAFASKEVREAIRRAEVEIKLSLAGRLSEFEEMYNSLLNSSGVLLAAASKLPTSSSDKEALEGALPDAIKPISSAAAKVKSRLESSVSIMGLTSILEEEAKLRDQFWQWLEDYDKWVNNLIADCNNALNLERSRKTKIDDWFKRPSYGSTEVSPGRDHVGFSIPLVILCHVSLFPILFFSVSWLSGFERGGIWFSTIVLWFLGWLVSNMIGDSLYGVDRGHRFHILAPIFASAHRILFGRLLQRHDTREAFKQYRSDADNRISLIEGVLALSNAERNVLSKITGSFT